MLSEPRAYTYLGISLPKSLVMGRRQPAYRGHESDLGFYKELREPVVLMTRENSKVEKTLREKVLRQETGAEQSVVAKKCP